MSPRKNYRRRDVESSIDRERLRCGVDAVQTHPDGEWLVRKVSTSSKTYRCPGCDHEIRPGDEHIVAWPADDRGDLTDRRHWHTGCWRARARRAPDIQRARNAPRYG